MSTKNKVTNLDAHASTQMAPEVLATVCRVLANSHANSASDHSLGTEARDLVEIARDEVAALLNANADEIVFTPGATEAINLAIQGFLHYQRKKLPKNASVVTSLLEHRAVLEAVERSRQDLGIEPRLVDSGPGGRIEPETIGSKVDENTVLVCLSHANGEIGTINPIQGIGEVIKARSLSGFMVDASQSAAYLPIDTATLPADLIVISSHKMHGPKGVAALFVRRGTCLDPVICGGGQERGLWPGTINQALVVGFGVAARITRERRQERYQKVRALRDVFWECLQSGISGITVNGHPDERLPGNLSLTIEGVPARRLRQLSSLALSSSSACTSRWRESSHVLRAIGLTERQAACTVRIGLAEDLSPEEVKDAGTLFTSEIRRLRESRS
jgi:cysteine desulfurase